jgi:hypothetical protein
MNKPDPEQGSKSLALIIPAIAVILVCLILLADYYLSK